MAAANPRSFSVTHCLSSGPLPALPGQEAGADGSVRWRIGQLSKAALSELLKDTETLAGPLKLVASGPSGLLHTAVGLAKDRGYGESAIRLLDKLDAAPAPAAPHAEE